MIEGSHPLPDSAFNASSYLSSLFKPHFARLNSVATAESSGSWSPAINDQMQYLQIAFDRPTPLYGVIIRGNPILAQYVTSFKILHSHNGIAFHYLVDDTTRPQIFSGPIDSRTPVKSLFKIPIESKVVRIYPLTWYGAIAIRVELLGCSNEKVNETYPVHVDTVEPAICDDALGVSNGKLRPEQIKVSSFKSTSTHEKEKALLKLTSDRGWRPGIDSPNQYVLFDFLEPRNITGIETKGGPNGWVNAYNVHYSPDFKFWNTILDENDEPKVFLANFDSDTPKINYFEHPIRARGMKIMPAKWHDCIELRVEPIGCFAPYPDNIPTKIIPHPVVKNVSPTCGLCPNMDGPAPMIEETCRCVPPTVWNGAECVQSTECPCIIDHSIYAIGSVFEKEDCSSCVCMLGGFAECSPQKCSPCEEGLRRSDNISCSCICEPCPPDTIICPTNGACIPEGSWCDGIQDCPDDEVSCAFKVKNAAKIHKKKNEKVVITKTCPEPECPPGYEIKIIGKVKSRFSPVFGQDGGKAEVYHPVGTQENLRKVLLQTTIELEENTEEESSDVICDEYECVPDRPKKIAKIQAPVKCPEPNCPSGYEVVMDITKISTSNQCSKFKCEPMAQRDAICNVTGKAINTFDELEYKYDICDHILAREFKSNNWTVICKYKKKK